MSSRWPKWPAVLIDEFMFFTPTVFPLDWFDSVRRLVRERFEPLTLEERLLLAYAKRLDLETMVYSKPEWDSPIIDDFLVALHRNWFLDYLIAIVERIWHERFEPWTLEESLLIVYARQLDAETHGDYCCAYARHQSTEETATDIILASSQIVQRYCEHFILLDPPLSQKRATHFSCFAIAASKNPIIIHQQLAAVGQHLYEMVTPPHTLSPNMIRLIEK